MDSYIDITILRDPEFPVPQLMSALYAKLHKGLATLSTDAIGVSFPDVSASKPSLGSKMRVHGSAVELGRLMTQPWLAGMRDHVSVADLAKVPSDAKHRLVKRVQAKSGVDRLRRRLMKRHGIDEAEAAKRIPDTVAKRLELPFLQLSSGSTGQRFQLFLDHGEILSSSQAGTFNAYGLSATATVPWF